jgi:hypothetical protein
MCTMCDTGGSWPCAWAPSDLDELMDVRERWRRRNVKPSRKAADDHKFYLVRTQLRTD